MLEVESLSGELQSTVESQQRLERKMRELMGQVTTLHERMAASLKMGAVCKGQEQEHDAVPDPVRMLPKVLMLPKVSICDEQGTVPKAQGTAPKTQGTVPKTQGTVPKEQGTVPKEQGTVPKTQGTVPKTQGTVPKAKTQKSVEKGCDTELSDMDMEEDLGKESKGKRGRKRDSEMPLPFHPSRVRADCCRAVKNNHKLFTQCDKKPEPGSPYCASDLKEMEKRQVKEPLNGTVDERMEKGHKFTRYGWHPVSYVSVLEKMGKTVEEARAYWAAKGITLQEDDIAVKEGSMFEAPRSWIEPTATESPVAAVKKTPKPEKKSKASSQEKSKASSQEKVKEKKSTVPALTVTETVADMKKTFFDVMEEEETPVKKVRTLKRKPEEAEEEEAAMFVPKRATKRKVDSDDEEEEEPSKTPAPAAAAIEKEKEKESEYESASDVSGSASPSASEEEEEEEVKRKPQFYAGTWYELDEKTNLLYRKNFAKPMATWDPVKKDIINTI